MKVTEPMNKKSKSGAGVFRAFDKLQKAVLKPAVPFKFKPAKKDEGSPFTNGQRATRAKLALIGYDNLQNGPNWGTEEVDYDMAVDLLSDIAHLADEQGWDLETMLNTVKMHWQAER